ncbi:MAG: membrane protein insertion efficiency factor YidD [Desulfotignum sp.]|nr:membrane protein insertion efficiency factor YidD [Desulfotignum sp.]
MILPVVAILYLTLPAWGQSPPDPDTHENPILRFYQTYISGADGNRCPMYPSCSHYAARALKKHGPVMGWIMACDRLLRCGRSETRLSPQVRAHGRSLTLDPVEANDFWWFTPRPDPEGQ